MGKTTIMKNKILTWVFLAAAAVLLFMFGWDRNIMVLAAIIVCAIFGFYVAMKDIKTRGNDLSGDPLSPEKINARRENLEKILALAAVRPRLTVQDAQKSLGLPVEAVVRHLEYLVNLGKLAKGGERGQQVYYEVVQK